MATVDLNYARKFSHAGLYRITPFKYTGPASYQAGGDPLTAADIGFTPEVIPDLLLFNGSAIRLAHWNPTTSKMVIYIPNTGAEASGDLSAYTGFGVAFGK